jgi:hypothetical protein
VSLWDKITSVSFHITSVRFIKWHNFCMFDDAVTDSSVSVELIQKFWTFNCASFPKCRGWNACKKGKKKWFVYKMPSRCNRWFLIADPIACSTCFGLPYAHHQELETIIQVIVACGIWCFGFQVVGMEWSWGLCSPQTGHTTLSPTPYRQLENRRTKYHRKQPTVYHSRAPDDVHNGAWNMLSKQ